MRQAIAIALRLADVRDAGGGAASRSFCMDTLVSLVLALAAVRVAANPPPPKRAYM